MGRHLADLPPGFALEGDMPQPTPVTPDLPPGFVLEDTPSTAQPTAPQQEPPRRDVTMPYLGAFHDLTSSVMGQGFLGGFGDDGEAAASAFAGVTKNWIAGKPANWQQEY